MPNDPVESQNLPYVEAIYARFCRDPGSIPDAWRRYFARLAQENGLPRDWDPSPSFAPPRPPPHENADGVETVWVGQRGLSTGSETAARAQRLVDAYRRLGPRFARLDPLGQVREPSPELDPGFHGLGADDLERRYALDFGGTGESRPLHEILRALRDAYGGPLAVEASHLESPEARRWLVSRVETSGSRAPLAAEVRKRLLTRLIEAGVFEKFIQGKYRGAKSFSVEGSEILLPTLDLVLEAAAADDVDDVVLGMAHRGRLNVLVNIIGKDPAAVFAEFEDSEPEAFLGGGDVKYHLGASGDWSTRSGRTVHVSLCFNPSHLEFVNPVAQGRMRARQDRREDTERRRGMVVLVHGDAGFAGEGIVQESLNLGGLPGYTTGGGVHVILDNQLGFTTSPSEGRAFPEPSDLAKVFGAPVFHVHGEHPEAAARAVRLAMEFRSRFRRDVVIRLVGYRRHGHNEGDEPAFTQPLMYRAIRERKPLSEIYLDRLRGDDERFAEHAGTVERRYRERLRKALATARNEEVQRRRDRPSGRWEGYLGGPAAEADTVETAVDPARLSDLLATSADLPTGFSPHRIIQRAMKRRREMASGDRPLDWSAAEALAFMTLSAGGHRIRLGGQDSVRGTFSQRHAVLHDSETGKTYRALGAAPPARAEVEILNSPLSEAGVLGFEYGYSLDCPDGLVAWEAQFGDFVNAAQVIVDQFLASAEDKWDRLSGLVLLLPHGFEGMGPEHSSARLERFLELSAEDSLQVVQPTTPGQYFHVLRRQVLRRWRKPLIVLTPKSLLRHPECRSSLEDLGRGEFRALLTEDGARGRSGRRKTILCTGKIYYDLLRRREDRGIEDVSIWRLEQLAPFPARELGEALGQHGDPGRLLWVQEEPANMGAWSFVLQRTRGRVLGGHPLARISRPASASPASGSAGASRIELEAILDAALCDNSGDARETDRAEGTGRNGDSHGES